MHVLDGEVCLKTISKPRGWPDVIMVFLRPFTMHSDAKLIAVIVPPAVRAKNSQAAPSGR